MDLDRALLADRRHTRHPARPPVAAARLRAAAAGRRGDLVLAGPGQPAGGQLASARRTAELEYRIAELSGALKSLVEQIAGLADAARLHAGRAARPGSVPERTGQSLKQLHERLAVIDAAQKNIAALSSEMLTLKDILSNKQARGAYGQARMEAIIRDGLHAAPMPFRARSATARGPTAWCRCPTPASSW